MNCQFYLFPGQTVNTIAENPLIYTHLFNPFSFSDFKFSLTCKTLLFLGPQSFQIVTPSRSDFPLSEALSSGFLPRLSLRA